jgi:hypothetical protein
MRNTIGDGNELESRGLYVDMPPWHYHSSGYRNFCNAHVVILLPHCGNISLPRTRAFSLGRAIDLEHYRRNNLIRVPTAGVF